MLTCNSCHRSAIRSIHIFDLHSAQAGVLSTFATKSSIPSASTTSTRNHATIANIQKGHHLRLLRLAFRSRERYPLSAKEIRKGPSPPQRRDQRAREANKRHLDINNDGDDVVRTLSKYTADSGLQTELQWTGGDALKLAQSVLDKLKADDAAKALEMIRLSEKMPGIQGSKSVDSVVSWNHVMDYYMSKSLTREAFKVFNEVGKNETPLAAVRDVG